MKAAGCRRVFTCSLLAILCGGLFGQRAAFEGVDFSKADSIASHYAGHSLRDLALLSDRLTTPLATDVEKFRAVYRWVCDNIAGDHTMGNRILRHRKRQDTDAFMAWNRTYGQRVLEVLFRKKKTMCSGYAYLVKELAEKQGIPCAIVNGYGRTATSNIGGEGLPNHSWNAVLLEGHWYLCDPTWSSGYFELPKGNFVRSFDDAYFLPDPHFFVLNHYPLDTHWLFLRNEPTLPDFLNAPIAYSAAMAYGAKFVFPATFDISASQDEHFMFSLQVGSGRQTENIQLEIVRGQTSILIRPAFTMKPDGTCLFEHVFPARGVYLVHLLMDGRYIWSYRVRVLPG